jgi:hypothetical protein
VVKVPYAPMLADGEPSESSTHISESMEPGWRPVADDATPAGAVAGLELVAHRGQNATVAPGAVVADQPCLGGVVGMVGAVEGDVAQRLGLPSSRLSHDP